MTTQTLLTAGNGLHTAPLVLQPVGRSRWPRRLLTPGRHTVGARADNDVQITVRGMAEAHAVIEVTGADIRLTALDRRTWVNDGPVTRCELHPGDRITIGPCTWALQPATSDDLLAGWPAPHLSLPSEDVRSHVEEADEPPAAPGPQALALIDETVQLLASVDAPAEEETEAPTEPTVPVPAAAQRIDEPLPSPVVTPSAALPPSAETKSPSPAELLRLHDSLLELRADLDRARTAWREETHRREVELAAESTAIARRGAALERAEHNFERHRQQLEAERKQWEAREAAQQRLSADLSRLQTELIAERERIEQLAQRTRDELEAEALRQNSAWLAWEESQQRMLADLTGQAQQLEARRTSLAAEREELQQARSEFERARRELAQAQREFDSEREQWTAQAEAWQARRTAMEAQHAAAMEQIERQQSQLSIEVRERGRQQTEFLAAQQQLQQDRRQFAELQHAWLTERETIWSDLSERRQRLESETTAIDQTRFELERLQAALEAERFELTRQRKLATEAQDTAKTASDAAERARVTAEGSIRAAEEFAAAQLSAALAESAARQARVIELEAELATAQQRAQKLDDELRSVATRVEQAEQNLAEVRDELSSPASGNADEEYEASDADHTTDFEAVQEALDALAARFEEFSELEQRLANKHDELRDLQQELAAREAELEARQLAWETGAARESHHSAETLTPPSETASRVAATDDVVAEKARWVDHLLQLQTLVDTPHGEENQTLPEETVPAEQAAALGMSDEIAASAAILEEDSQRSTAVDDVEPQETSLELPSSALSVDVPEASSPEVSAFIPVDPLAGPDVDAAPRQNPWLRFRENLLRETPNLASPYEGATGTPDEMTESSAAVPSFDAAPSWESAAPYDAAAANDWEAPPLPFADTEETSPADWAAPAYDTFTHNPADDAVEEVESQVQRRLERDDETQAESSSDARDEHSPLAAASLRSELAKMFDLPEDFVQKHVATPGEPEAREELTAEQSVEERPGEAKPDVAEEAAEEAEDDWRSRLSAALTQMPSRPSEPEPQSDRDQPEPIAVADRAAAGEEGDDSVASYMAQLLARTRRSSTYEPEAEPEPTVKNAPDNARTPEPVVQVAEPVEPRPSPSEPRAKVDKDATRAEMQSFRQVANLSARAALARHTWRTTSTELTIQTALAGCCALGAGAYLGAGLLGHEVQWVPGIGCSVGAVFVGYRAWQTLSKLRQWSRTIEEAARVAAAGAAVPAADEEDEDAISPELLAALLAGRESASKTEPTPELPQSPVSETPPSVSSTPAQSSTPPVHATPLSLEEELLLAEPLGGLPSHQDSFPAAPRDQAE